MKILSLLFALSLLFISSIQVFSRESSSALITISPRGEVTTQNSVLGVSNDNKSQISVGVEEIEIKLNNGGANLRAKTATGSSTLKTDGSTTLVKIESAERKNDITLLSKNGKLVLEQNGLAVATKFDLRVDTDTNSIFASTPNGDTRVAALPTQVLDTLTKNNKIDRSVEIELVNEAGKFVYKVIGEKDAKLFGLIQTEFSVVGFVDAGTGEVVGVDFPFVLRFFGFLFIK